MSIRQRFSWWWARYRLFAGIRPDAQDEMSKIYRDMLIATFAWSEYRSETIPAIGLQVTTRLTLNGMPLFCALRWSRWVMREIERRKAAYESEIRR